MDLDSLLKAIRGVLHEAAQVPPNMRGRIEMRIDIEVLDHIEWHLSNHRRQNGNLNRPPPRDPPPRDKKERTAQEEAEEMYRQRKTRRGYEETRSYNEEFMNDYFRRAQAEADRRTYEEIRNRAYGFSGFSGFNSAKEDVRWEDVFGSSFRGNYGGEEQKKSRKPKSDEKKRPWPEVLGVRETATKPEATKAYRRLCMRFHPDRKPEGNHEKFVELQQAWKESPFGR